MKLVNLDLLIYFWGKLKLYFVKQVDGKALSTNDYTTAEKNKLAGIATSAQVNVIESVKLNGTALTVASKAVNIDLSDYVKKGDVTTVLRYRGSVQTYSALPTASNAVGDTYNIEQADAAHGVKAGDNAVWNGTTWDILSGTVDLSGYVTKDEFESQLEMATTTDIDNMMNSDE
jgi:hypothetical protein